MKGLCLFPHLSGRHALLRIPPPTAASPLAHSKLTTSMVTAPYRSAAAMQAKPGVHIDDSGDRVLTPRPYYSSTHWQELLERTALHLQRLCRGWIARKRAAELRSSRRPVHLSTSRPTHGTHRTKTVHCLSSGVAVRRKAGRDRLALVLSLSSTVSPLPSSTSSMTALPAFPASVVLAVLCERCPPAMPSQLLCLRLFLLSSSSPPFPAFWTQEGARPKGCPHPGARARAHSGGREAARRPYAMAASLRCTHTREALAPLGRGGETLITAVAVPPPPYRVQAPHAP